ncbi:MAG: hypothetical protein COB50_03170 [Thiotrichales bacterium]|nr:MAG: hypothetical protein COB50_03170 [Thiotrichales bacterium]
MNEEKIIELNKEQKSALLNVLECLCLDHITSVGIDLLKRKAQTRINAILKDKLDKEIELEVRPYYSTTGLLEKLIYDSFSKESETSSDDASKAIKTYFDEFITYHFSENNQDEEKENNSEFKYPSERIKKMAEKSKVEITEKTMSEISEKFANEYK